MRSSLLRIGFLGTLVAAACGSTNKPPTAAAPEPAVAAEPAAEPQPLDEPAPPDAAEPEAPAAAPEAPVAAPEPGPWTEVAVTKVRKKIKAKDGDESFASPDKKAQLIFAGSAPSEGDFPQAPVYLVHKGKAVALGSYRSVHDVQWSDDSKTVRFRGHELADYGKDDINEIEYGVGGATLRKRTVGQAEDQPSG